MSPDGGRVAALTNTGDPMKKLISLAAAGTLVFAACGGDDDGGGSSVDDVVNALVDAFEADPDLEGISLDESCVRGVAEGLSESDREKIAEAFANDTDPEGLSPEGEAASLELIDCIDLNLDELVEE